MVSLCISHDLYNVVKCFVLVFILKTFFVCFCLSSKVPEALDMMLMLTTISNRFSWNTPFLIFLNNNKTVKFECISDIVLKRFQMVEIVPKSWYNIVSSLKPMETMDFDNSFHTILYWCCTLYQERENISTRFSSNSEACVASELLENIEEIFSRY